MGKAVGGGLGAVTGTAGNLVGGATGGIFGSSLGQQIFGKDDPGVAASQVNIYTPEQQALLKKATGSYSDILDKNDQIAQNAGVAQENQIRAIGDRKSVV